MNTDDDYLTWNAGPPQGYAASTAQDPNGATACINPAGLIYKLEIGTYTKSDTAWGAGTGFSGANWATYITFTLS
jgi:hypothetical protein